MRQIIKDWYEGFLVWILDAVLDALFKNCENWYTKWRIQFRLNDICQWQYEERLKAKDEYIETLEESCDFWKGLENEYENKYTELRNEQLKKEFIQCMANAHDILF